MKSRSTTFLILFYLLTVNTIKSQSIAKTWFCAKSNLCFYIDSTAKCLSINENNGIEDCSRSKYKRNGNVLVVIIYNNQTIFGWQKSKTKFRIDKLTNDSLHLTLIKTKDLALLETLNIKEQEQLLFFYKKDGCNKK